MPRPFTLGLFAFCARLAGCGGSSLKVLGGVAPGPAGSCGVRFGRIYLALID